MLTMRRIVLGAVGGCMLALGSTGMGGCASVSKGTDESAAESAPGDFWVGVTVMGPTRSAAGAAGLERALKPGRYVVEPDRGLRISLGVGAQETTFPPVIRTLTRAEYAELWRLVNGAGWLDAAHPNVASGNGTVDPETIQGKTVYIVTAHSAERRELIVMEVDPECGEWCGKGKRVVEWMAGKGWMKTPEPAAFQSPVTTPSR